MEELQNKIRELIKIEKVFKVDLERFETLVKKNRAVDNIPAIVGERLDLCFRARRLGLDAELVQSRCEVIEKRHFVSIFQHTGSLQDEIMRRYGMSLGVQVNAEIVSRVSDSNDDVLAQKMCANGDR